VDFYSNYAFVTLRDRTLVATAPLIPPFPVSGARQLVQMERPLGLKESDAAVPPLHVPPALNFALPPPQRAAAGEPTADGGLSEESVESRIYWRLRHAPRPRPNDKEVRESLAVFKQVNKLLKGKRVVYDVCGSHGFLGALFLAYGKAERAVVIDKFQPNSFVNVVEAMRPFLRRGQQGEMEQASLTPILPSCHPPFL
jgi:hypothetical protein